MFNQLKYLFGYLHYYFTAQTRFDIHSPFIYAFVEEVINDRRNFYAFQEIEQLRKFWIKRNETYTYKELGAGALTTASNRRNTAQIAKQQAVSAHYGKLLFRLVDHFQPEIILELGTSLGIGTAYLVTAKKQMYAVSVEGCEVTAEKARETFKQLGIEESIELLKSDFNTALNSLVQQKFKADLVYVDGHHDGAATFHYFELLKKIVHKESLIIFDDIRWSGEMLDTWKKITEDPAVAVSVDLYKMGLVFFRDGYTKQHFTIRYV